MKTYLILAFVFLFLGVTALAGSGYYAFNYYFASADEGTGFKVQNEKEEAQINTKIDSDKDGISDKEEVDIYGTNPNKSDTDGDGYTDKVEIDGGYDPLTPPSPK